MARKSYTGLDQFKKYRDNRKKAETFRKRSHRKAWGNLKKISRQKDLVRRKRMASYKNKHSSVSSEHESQRKGCTLFTVIGIIALVALFSLIGPFGILIIVLMAISALIIFIVKRTKKSVVRTLSKEEIDELQRHLSNIDLYKDMREQKRTPMRRTFCVNTAWTGTHFGNVWRERRRHDEAV